MLRLSPQSLHNLPIPVQEKFLDRLRVNELTPQDVKELQSWLATFPIVPEGNWCKVLRSGAKVVGTGLQIDSLLGRDKPCFGEKISHIIENWLPEF
jgi:hypothetical protein